MILSDTGTDRIQLGETLRIWVMGRDSAGAGVTGATIALTIRRDVDSFFWNGTTWQSGATTVSMTQADATNLAGLYYYDFEPKTTDFSAVFYATTATAAIVNDPFCGSIIVGRWVDDLDAAVSSRGSSTDAGVLMSRLGASFVDNEFLSLRALLGQVQIEQKQQYQALLETINDMARRMKFT